MYGMLQITEFYDILVILTENLNLARAQELDYRI